MKFPEKYWLNVFGMRILFLEFSIHPLPWLFPPTTGSVSVDRLACCTAISMVRRILYKVPMATVNMSFDNQSEPVVFFPLNMRDCVVDVEEN